MSLTSVKKNCISHWLSELWAPIGVALLQPDQSVGYPARTRPRSKDVAKGQRRGNKEIRKPKKSAEAKKSVVALPARESVKSAIGKAT